MFVTLEGIEGCGKSTQARRLVDRLEGTGVSCILTLEPGGTPMGKEIRRILLDSNNKDLPPLSELLLYEADRALHMEMVIKPALVMKNGLCVTVFLMRPLHTRAMPGGRTAGLSKCSMKKHLSAYGRISPF